MGPKALTDMLMTFGTNETMRKRPVYISGPPGVGKSAIARLIASMLKEQFLDIRCLLHDPSDMKFPIVTDGKLTWVNSLFPKDPEWRGIVCLEEIDKCDSMMQGALLQPTLDRRIGDHVIPDGVWFILIGNRKEDQAGGHHIITPLRSRCIRVNLDVSVEDWNDWAVEAGIDFRVRTFLHKIKPNLLWQFDASRDCSPNPRSWEFVSDIRKAYTQKVEKKAKDGDMKKMSLFDPIAGCVDEGAAAEFLGYCRIADNLPDIDKDILGNPEKAFIPEMPDLMWAICGAIVERVRNGAKKVISAAWTYTLRLPDEFSIMLGKDMLTANRSITSDDRASDWIRKHKYTVLAK
jgi:hypothetical protein